MKIVPGIFQMGAQRPPQFLFHFFNCIFLQRIFADFGQAFSNFSGAYVAALYVIHAPRLFRKKIVLLTDRDQFIDQPLNLLFSIWGIGGWPKKVLKKSHTTFFLYNLVSGINIL